MLYNHADGLTDSSMSKLMRDLFVERQTDVEAAAGYTFNDYDPQGHRDDLTSEDIAGLRSLVDQDPRKPVPAPNPKLPAPLVATAWETLLSCMAFDSDAVACFIETFRDQGPEDVN